MKDTPPTSFAFGNLEQYLPSSILILTKSASEMVLGYQTSIIANGNTFFKEIHVRPTSWQLVVRTKVIDLINYDISPNFSCNSNCLKDIIAISDKLKICCGVDVHDKHVSKSFIKETIAIVGNETSSREVIRSKY